MNTTMTKRIPSIPKGATGVYRSDCPTSPSRFEDGETTDITSDIPEVPIIFDSDSPVKVNFSATMYLMFIPSLRYAIYVPVSSVDWNWAVTASYKGIPMQLGAVTDYADWVLSGESESPSNPNVKANTTEPTWSAVYVKPSN
jgi:hypothetical protein